MTTTRLLDFPPKSSPIPADIVYCGDSADGFNEVQCTIAQLISAYPNLSNLAGLSITNNSVFSTNGSGVIQLSNTLPSGISATNMNLTTPSLGVASATSISFGGSALNTYVTGTWTPVLQFGGASTGITYSSQFGEYTQIGNCVFVVGIITLSSKGSASGNASIHGLPIAVGGAGNNASMLEANPQNITLHNNNMILYINVNGVGTQGASIVYTQSASGNALYTDTDFANNSQISFSGFYFAS